MHRIDNSSAVASKPALPGSSTPGYFDPGDPVAERDATILDYFWANTVQEELAAIVAAAGMALDRTNDAQVLAALRSLIAAIPHGVQVFSAVTTSNFVVPAGVTLIDVELWGGGAGSYASYSTQRSGGGGAGGYARRRLAVTPGQIIAVTIGGGGAAGITSGVTWPGNGATSSFGGYMTATGGRINSLSNPTTSIGNGGESGTASGGDLNIQGSSGGPATPTTTGMGGASGIGGTIGSGTTGVTGIAPGGGAAGAGFLSDGVTPCAGAAGAPGLCIVRW